MSDSLSLAPYLLRSWWISIIASGRWSSQVELYIAEELKSILARAFNFSFKWPTGWPRPSNLVLLFKASWWAALFFITDVKSNDASPEIDVDVRTAKDCDPYDDRLFPFIWNQLRETKCSPKIIKKIISFAWKFHARHDTGVTPALLRLLTPYYSCVKVLEFCLVIWRLFHHFASSNCSRKSKCLIHGRFGPLRRQIWCFCQWKTSILTWIRLLQTPLISSWTWPSWKSWKICFRCI